MRILEFISLGNEEIKKIMSENWDELFKISKKFGDYYKRITNTLDISDLHSLPRYNSRSILIKSRIKNINAAWIRFDGGMALSSVAPDSMSLLFGFTVGNTFVLTADYEFSGRGENLQRIIYYRRTPHLSPGTSPEQIVCKSGEDVLRLLREDGMIK